MADPEDIERRIQEREAKIRRLKEAEEREKKIAALDRKEQMVNSMRVGAVVLVGVLVLAGAVWAYATVRENLEEKSCDFHEHATFQMVIDGAIQRWNHPAFDMAGQGSQGILPPRGHMHQPDESQMHLEFGCITVKQFFANMRVELNKNSFTMDEIMHDGQTYKEEGNKTLSYYLLHKVDGEWKWEEYTSKILDHQMRDHQKLLILYGEYTEEEIAAYQAGVPNASGIVPDDHPGAGDS